MDEPDQRWKCSWSDLDSSPSQSTGCCKQVQLNSQVCELELYLLLSVSLSSRPDFSIAPDVQQLVAGPSDEFRHD